MLQSDLLQPSREISYKTQDSRLQKDNANQPGTLEEVKRFFEKGFEASTVEEHQARFKKNLESVLSHYPKTQTNDNTQEDNEQKKRFSLCQNIPSNYQEQNFIKQGNDHDFSSQLLKKRQSNFQSLNSNNRDHYQDHQTTQQPSEFYSSNEHDSSQSQSSSKPQTTNQEQQFQSYETPQKDLPNQSHDTLKVDFTTPSSMAPEQEIQGSLSHVEMPDEEIILDKKIEEDDQSSKLTETLDENILKDIDPVTPQHVKVEQQSQSRTTNSSTTLSVEQPKTTPLQIQVQKFEQQLENLTRFLLSHNRQKAQITLNPENFGTVTVDIDNRETGHYRISIVSQTSLAHNLFVEYQEQLEKALAMQDNSGSQYTFDFKQETSQGDSRQSYLTPKEAEISLKDSKTNNDLETDQRLLSLKV